MKARKQKKLQEKEQLEEEELQRIKQKNRLLKEKTLAILKPGRYLMLNQNRYFRVNKDTSVLLINSFDELGKIALLNDDLLIVNENEIKIQ